MANLRRQPRVLTSPRRWALALGADAVLIGRPHIYGLALDGADGARDAVSNIVAELDLTLGLSGQMSVRTLDSSALERL